MKANLLLALAIATSIGWVAAADFTTGACPWIVNGKPSLACQYFGLFCGAGG